MQLHLKTWGINGYPEVVPGSGWAACSIYKVAALREARPKPELSYTAIYPFQDDPLFQWRTTTNSPWLSKQECEVINLPHRKIFWLKEARTCSLDHDADFARDRAALILRRESLLRHRYEHPAVAVENEIGGWLPKGSGAAGMSQTAQDLCYRESLKAAKAFGEADLVRRVVTGGSVEVSDMPNGVLWFFS